MECAYKLARFVLEAQELACEVGTLCLGLNVLLLRLLLAALGFARCACELFECDGRVQLEVPAEDGKAQLLLHLAEEGVQLLHQGFL